MDVSFTFKELNSYERKIVHEIAEKYKLYHQTINEKITISRVELTNVTNIGVTPTTEVTEVNEVSKMMDKVHITEEPTGYNLRSRNKKNKLIKQLTLVVYFINTLFFQINFKIGRILTID